jgi:hypothetical protein
MSAKRLNPAAGDAARGVRMIDHAGLLIDPQIRAHRSTRQPNIRAELSGDGRCTALGLTAVAAAPVLAMCRALIAANHDPASSLEAWRGDVLCLRICSIGEAARLAVEAGRDGVPRFVVRIGISAPAAAAAPPLDRVPPTTADAVKHPTACSEGAP